MLENNYNDRINWNQFLIIFFKQNPINSILYIIYIHTN